MTPTDSSNSDETRLETLVDPDLVHSDQLPSDGEVTLELGRFKILRPLGEGGMGQVFLAEQTEPVQRKVAVKVIRSKLHNTANLARFDVERQALAQMSHPAIAQVFDAGTTAQGHPYFVMEYIDGVRLDEFCRQQRLKVRERLALFILICRAVQHAHNRGIVHRDLKPANILVRRVDGAPAPKIIDFGIATAVQQQGPDSGSSRDLAGTPRYMSPEQFCLDQSPLDGRSDVYSLGVLLYELLVDQPPLDHEHYETASQTGNLDSLTERLPPPPPSSRLLMNTSSRAMVAEARRTTVRRLQRRLKTDIDSVVLKALENDPADRYDSAQSLADDIVRVLERRPVQARPNTRVYRLSRFLRRNAIAVGSASAILLALIAGLTAATLGMLEAQRQFEIAEQRQQELEQVVGFQQSMLVGVDPQAMGIGLLEGLREQYEAGVARRPDSAPPLPDIEPLVSQISGTELARRMLNQHLLSQAKETIEQDFQGQPALQARLYTSLHSVYQALGISSALPELTETLLERLVASGETDPARLLEARFWQASAWFDVGERERSVQALEAIVADTEALPEDPDGLAVRARGSLGVSLVETGNSEEAIRQVTTALNMARERFGNDNMITIRILGNLGYVHARAGDLASARRYFTEEVQALRQREDESQLGAGLLNLAAALGASGQLEEALEVHEETVAILELVYGLRHPISLRAMNNHAATLIQLQRNEEALPLLQQTLDLRIETLGAAHPETLRSQLNLGSMLDREGRPEEGLAMVESVVEQRRMLLGDSHLDTLQAKETLANILKRMGQHDEADRVISQVLEQRIEQLGDDHRLVDAARTVKARNQMLRGQAEASLPVMEALYSRAVEQWPEGHPLRVNRTFFLYHNLLAVGKTESAAALRGEALSILEPDDPETLPGPLKAIRERLLSLDESTSKQVQNDQ